MAVEPAAEPLTRTRAVAAPHGLAIGFAVFTSGAVLLGMELAASRVLAPFFGNSLFVWGALIGVVLAGLAVGYWLGGTLADRLPATWLLLAAMGLGALLVLLVPIVDEPVLEWVVGWDPGPRLNPLLTAVILFGPASVVLAAVTPIAVRLAARSVDTVGRTAGRLYAVSTAGSIAGTFATAFWLVPELGVSQLLALAATALLAAVALVAGVERLPVAAAVALLATAGAGVAAVRLAPEETGTLEGAAAQNWSPVYRSRDEGRGGIDAAAGGFDVVFQRDTRYHHLAVVDDVDGSRYLRFDNSFQSGMWLARPFDTRFAYTDYFDLALAYNPDARSVLFVGLGGASAPKQFWQDFPRLDLQVAELDPVVVDVARRYFEMPDDPRLAVAVEDGRRYLATNDRRYDVIAIDAYFSDSIPFHLTTREFVDLLRQRLAPGGVVVANVIGSLEGSGSKLLRAFVRTYKTAFPSVTVHPVIEPGDGGSLTELRNLMLVATEGALPSEQFLLERWQRLAPSGAPDLARAIRNRYDKPIRTHDVPTLTDDYAPTDSLLLVD
ncbi:MAG TPA: fused MFS/spermidine synthase [Gaiellaceae bacterium]|nr:fused MFS/spermidine synthase [Gaiellaceae bacterium]